MKVQSLVKVIALLFSVVVLGTLVKRYQDRFNLLDEEKVKEKFQDSRNVMSAEETQTENKPAPLDYPSTNHTGPSQCFPRDRLTAEDLLPNDAANSKFSQVNPAGQGDVDGRNFLQSTYHQGLNTVGSSLRNANRQLRSEPPNPSVQVSPWNMSSIDSDLHRRPLE